MTPQPSPGAEGQGDDIIVAARRAEPPLRERRGSPVVHAPRRDAKRGLESIPEREALDAQDLAGQVT